VKTPLIERMQKRHAAKSWIKEVEAKDREIERLEETKDQYLNIINLLACEKEQLKAENAALKRGIRNAMNNLGVPNAGYPSPVAEAWAILDALLTEQEQDDE